MCRLPTYGEAISGGHWLEPAAPYVSIYDYAKLCRVSRRFYDEFAPRLWSDPLQTARLLGLHPNDALDWYLGFVNKHCHTVRDSTRQLVTCIDFRGFAYARTSLISGLGGLNSGAGASGSGSFSETLRWFGSRFPGLRCILMDGSLDYDPGDFFRPVHASSLCSDGSVPVPAMVSLAHCSLPLPNTFLQSDYWRQLVYLDMSDLPSTLSGFLSKNAFHPSALPSLRILKICGMEMRDVSLEALLGAFGDRLWSLDLGRNSLTDQGLGHLGQYYASCLKAASTVDCTETEGRLAVIHDDAGHHAHSDAFGELTYIVESEWSRDSSHHARYFSDSPAYDPHSHWRLGGCEPLRSDDEDDVKAILVGGTGKPIPDWTEARNTLLRRPLIPVLTHLHISDNKRITMDGVGGLIRESKGHLQQLDCAAPLIPKTATDGRAPIYPLAGVLGHTHHFRPVFSTNLQSLRIHHSLVTLVPTVIEDGPFLSEMPGHGIGQVSRDRKKATAMERLRFAETVLHERATTAFPQAFVPDTNPRLQSLTLTCLPRLSVGPLIDKLLRFLTLLAKQEQDIQSVRGGLTGGSSGSFTRSQWQEQHRPSILRGLRHIRLEFEPWPTDDEEGLDLDAQSLLESTDMSSFFRHQESRPSDGEGGQYHERQKGQVVALTAAAVETDPAMEAPPLHRLIHYPLQHHHVQMVGSRDTVHAKMPWSECGCGEGEVGEAATCAGCRCVCAEPRVPVWVGSGTLGTSRAVNQYMRNLANDVMASDIGPATPDHAEAGVPAGTCIFRTAWNAMLFGGGEEEEAAKRETETCGRLAPMQDVVEVIRKYRQGTRASYTAYRNQQEQKEQKGQNEQNERNALLRAAHGHWTGKLEILVR